MRKVLISILAMLSVAMPVGLAVGAGEARLAKISMEPPSGAFIASARQDFKLTCVLAAPLEVGSEIRVLTPREGGWSQPSLDPSKEEMPGAFGLVTYRLLRATNPATRLVGKAQKYSDRGPPYGEKDRVSQFVLRVEGAALAPDDAIEVAFPQTRVSRVAIHRDPARNVTGYRVQIRPAGSKDWQEVEGLPRFQVLPAEPQALEMRIPSQITCGEPFTAALHVRDAFQNPAQTFTGEVTLKCSDPNAALPTAVIFRPDDRGVIAVDGLRLRTPGVHTLTPALAKNPPNGSAASCLIEALPEAPVLRLFWGELHCHGALSYDARNWGGCTMRPADMYWYARHIQNLDFAAVTDHSMHSNVMRQQNMTEEEFRELQAAAQKNNEDGRFVAFTAVEQRCARGDTNVFFLRDDESWYMKSGPITIQQLWDFYLRSDLFTIPHMHPPIKRPERFDSIDPDKERLIEIHSNHGRYEFHNNDPLFPKKGMVEGNNVQAILSRGHRLGIVAASDDHSGRPGSFDLTGVYAAKLTREAIFSAIRARHTYGTTRARINVEFRLGEHMMGDELRVRQDDPLWRSRRFSVRVIGPRNLKQLEIVRNGKVVFAIQPKTNTSQFEYVDVDPLDQTWLGTEKNNPPTVYYYLRVTLEPEGGTGPRPIGMAWTSPIYLSPG